jgi:pyruvate dehydrogenase E2 component (dihydrolipoamide acetyltransferase)
MAEVVKMPRLSDTMTDGVVAKWHKKIGDQIKEGDLLADIETDKATMEFESFQEGFLLYIGVKENETAKVDAILAILGKKGEDINSLLESEDIKTDNVTNEINQSKEVSSKEIVQVITEPDSQSIQETAENRLDTRLRISPLAKKIAKEKHIDFTKIKGSGDFGRIIKRDIDNFESSSASSLTESKSQTIEIPISQMRKTIANRLSASKFSSPHFYLNVEVDMGILIKERQRINAKNNIKISFNDIVVKAVSMAIQKHPDINSSWCDDHIKMHQGINIGVAVSVDNGLIVPVIKNANFKSLSDISIETSVFAQKAKDNKLQPSDWEGNTFTISNLGMFGIDDFTAIINPPDACILAVGAIKEKPIVKEDVIVPGHIMRLTLSCDHRIVDGVAGAKFLSTLKNMLESPLMMFC